MEGTRGPVRRWLTTALLLLVRLYQRALRPLLPPSCRFYPSCSEYMAQALALHGPFKGLGLGLRRVSRCHPWNPGGVDPVPGSSPREKGCY